MAVYNGIPDSLISSLSGSNPATVYTESIKKLKAIPEHPEGITDDNKSNYYIEPVTIEYYVTKNSRFASEIKYLYIPLVDPEPSNENSEKIFNYFKGKNEPIDVMEVMNIFPEHLINIIQYYEPVLNLYENMAVQFRSGMKEDPESIKKALYLNEVLRKMEPSLPSLNIIGDFINYNINWCVRFLNLNRIEHSLEDGTVANLILRYRLSLQKKNEKPDQRFEILTSIYMEQAFPPSDDLYADEYD